MTDHDHELQDAFDRHLRGEGPPPDTEDDPEAAAYEAVYAALGTPPEGDLPAQFAEQVADRVDLRPAPAFSIWEIVTLFLLIAAVGGSLVALPSVTVPLRDNFVSLLHVALDLSYLIRVDVLGAAGLVLALTVAVDAVVRCLKTHRRHAPSTS